MYQLSKLSSDMLVKVTQLHTFILFHVDRLGDN